VNYCTILRNSHQTTESVNGFSGTYESHGWQLRCSPNLDYGRHVLYSEEVNFTTPQPSHLDDLMKAWNTPQTKVLPWSMGAADAGRLQFHLIRDVACQGLFRWGNGDLDLSIIIYLPPYDVEL